MAIRQPIDAEADLEALDARVSFEELWEHQTFVRDLCTRILGDGSAADDVVQETFLRAYSNLDRIDREQPLRNWLAVVARRRCLDELRRRKRHAEPCGELPERRPASEPDPLSIVTSNDEVDRVLHAMGGLRPRERHLLARQVLEGATLAELAADVGSSVASVRSVLSRARSKLGQVVGGDRFPVFVPLIGATRWVRRRLGQAASRVQEMGAATPAALERARDAVAAAVAVAALFAGGTPPPASGAPPAPSAGTSVAGETLPVEPVAVVASGSLPRTRGDAGAVEQIGVVSAVLAPTVEGTGELGHDPEHSGDPGDDAGGSVPGTGDLPRVPQPFGPEEQPDEPEDVHGEGFAQPSPEEDETRESSTLFMHGGAQHCLSRCDVLFRSDDFGASWSRVDAEAWNGGTVLVPPLDPWGNERVLSSDSEGIQLSRTRGESFEPWGPTPGARGVDLAPDLVRGDERALIEGDAPVEYDLREGSYIGALPEVPLAGRGASLAYAPDYATTGRFFAVTIDTTPTIATSTVAALYECNRFVGCARRHRFGDSSEGFVIERVYRHDGEERIVVRGKDSRLPLISRDGGTSFVPLAGFEGWRLNELSVGPRGRMAAAVAREVETPSGFDTVGGVFTSADGGLTWTHRRSRGIDLEAGVAHVALLRTGHMLASPLHGLGVYCSADDGRTWAARCPSPATGS